MRDDYKISFFFMLVIALVLGGFLVITWMNPPVVEKEVIKEQPEKAMVLFYFDSWGENINNSNEVIFSGWIYNFGPQEAKNVTVRCYVERDGEEIYSTIYNAGNVGSTSYKYVDIVKKYKSVSMDEVGVCVIDQCGDNCIDLYSRMPEE